MFRWIKALFRKKKDENRYDLFLPQERMIYQYFDGEKVRRVDPLEIFDKFMEVGPSLDIDIKVANSPSKDAKECGQRVLNTIRRIFDLKPLDEVSGMTRWETIDLFDHFFTYVSWLKKNSSRFATLPTGDTMPTFVSRDESPNTPPSAVTGLTENELKTAVPESSPSAPESPTEPSPVT